MNRLLLWMLGLFLTLVGICKNPMLLIFPMWIFTSLNKERLRRLVQGVSLRSLIHRFRAVLRHAHRGDCHCQQPTLTSRTADTPEPEPGA